MTQPIMHPCGLTLIKLASQIREAVHRVYWNDPRHGRYWYYVISGKHKFHPSVEEALGLGAPRDLHQLVLEHPHISMDGRLAYTQNDDKGERDIQTVTTVGRYLTRHFPCFADHQIRTIAGRKQGCRIVETMDEMQDALMRGPQSCMKWDSKDNPYQSYCPSLGWALAINESGDDIIGRALVHKPTKSFVRTYRKDGNSTRSCELLQGWLKHQGFAHLCDWPDGTKLHKIDGRAPYLDGADHRADQDGDFWVVSEGGAYLLNNTNGSYDRSDEDDDDYVGTCECCDSRVSENDDDRLWAYENEDTLICGDCSDGYTYVYGRRGNQYYVRDEDAIRISGEDYHDAYLADQEELRRLENGEYVHKDDCFFCDLAEEYYLCSEERQVELKDGDYAAECNAWKCSVSGDWYSTDEDFIEVDGEKVHPDNVVVEDPDDFELTPSPKETVVIEEKPAEPHTEDELRQYWLDGAALLKQMPIPAPTKEQNEPTENDAGVYSWPEAPAQRSGGADTDQLLADFTAELV